MSVERFRRYDRGVVGNNEGVILHAIKSGNKKQPLIGVRQTFNWMEFSVEHLSHYWKSVQIWKHDAAYQRLMQNLYTFAVQASRPEARLSSLDNHDNPMRETLAIMPWAPMNPRNVKTQTFDIVVLATQIASLLRCDCGRINLAFHAPNWNYTYSMIWPAVLDLLQEHPSSFLTWDGWWQDFSQRAPTPSPNRTTFLVGDTELILVPLETSMPRNMPIPTANHLYDVLFGDGTNDTAKNLQSAFLGPDAKRWKYIYYTEPDSPLQTRGYALPQFRQPLDQGLVLVPHRMQSAPHESDLVNGRNNTIPPTLYLPAIDNWTNVRNITDSCCDGGKSYYPAKDDFPGVRGFWYQHHFGGKLPRQDENMTEVLRVKFARMANYSIIRNPQGTNLAMFAAQQDGRRCVPIEGPCSSTLTS